MKALAWLLLVLAPVFAAMAMPPAAQPWRWRLPKGLSPPQVPPDNPMSAAKVALGRRLFHDADLSIDGTMSCASCHEQKRGFADGNATRPGVHGDPGRRNVPGLANIAWLPRLTWADPGLTTLEAQVAVPVLGLHPVEMGMAGKEAEIARRLEADACYRRMFGAAFPDRRGAINLATVSAALAAFERTLLSFDSPYDHYLQGRKAALSPAARRGRDSFFGASGCAACHAGPNLTDARYHAVPIAPTAADRGLVEKTGRAEDDGRFRTPSLRNVAVTGPWLHDGSATTLDEALRRHPMPVAAGDRPDLIAFLQSLTDPGFLRDRRFAYPDRVCGRAS
ncbi:cytochrome-c peroxidase [Sphingobium aquiterrae]|uniref:cytochrome-c peroxidase n=1 Tax=Sphingobium aquiterrae TaxID=2038656 RepID=UPI0030192C44